MNTLNMAMFAAVMFAAGCGKEEPCDEYAASICACEGAEVACETAEKIAEEASGDEDAQEACETLQESFDAAGGCDGAGGGGGGAGGDSGDWESPDGDGDADADGGGGGGGGLDGSCQDLADSYCACDGVDDTMCAAYGASLEGFTSDQCDPTLDAWNAAGGCDSLGG